MWSKDQSFISKAISIALQIGLLTYLYYNLAPSRDTMFRSLFYPKVMVPERNDSYIIKDIWTSEQAKKLLDIVKEKMVYETAARDQTSINEDIGEAVPIGEDGLCPHYLLVPNKIYTMCVLPDRIDIARHFFKHGGRKGLKESYETLASRLQIFTGFIFTDLNNPILAPLFKSEEYIRSATSSCGGKSIFDPI